MSRLTRVANKAVTVFQYLIAVLMMIEGVGTIVSPLTPMDGKLGYIYSQRASIVSLGVIIFVSGATLMLGQILSRKRMIGNGLLAIFGCFVFAAALETVAHKEFDVANAVAAVVTGSLYLRWRLKTQYINPKVFKNDVEYLKGNK